MPVYVDNLTQLRTWMVSYFLNLLASFGAVLGLFSTYRIATSGGNYIMLLPTVLVLLFPFIFFFRRKVSAAIQMLLISLLFMLTIMAMVLHKGLAGNFLFVAPLLALCLSIFYGRRGFLVCITFLLVCITIATILGLNAGVPSLEFSSDRHILFRALTLLIFAVITCFSIRGIYLSQQQSVELITEQQGTIDKQAKSVDKSDKKADFASNNLALLEETLNCLVMTLAFNGTVTFKNKYAIDQFGPVRNGQFIFDIIADNKSAELFLSALDLAANGKTIAHFPCNLSGQNEEKLSYIIAAASRTDVSGQPLDMLLAATDVTELRKERDRLRNLNTLEAVGLACARISHDFANLLLVIQGNLDLLDRDALNSEEKSYVDDACKAVQDSVILTKQIGEFASAPMLHLRSVELIAFISTVQSNIAKICPSRVKLESDWSFSNEIIEIDDIQLNLILLNLAANARDAISHEGEITLRARLDHDDEIDRSTFSIDVIDNGCGIAPEHLDRITEPFFTTKALSSGMGLGLSTSARLIEEMGGSLKIFSQEGSGTTVSLCLPVNSM